MNATEKKYACGRIDEIAVAKQAEIRKATTTEAIVLSDEDRFDLVRSGKVKMFSTKEILVNTTYHRDIGDLFDFSKHEKEEVTDSVSRGQMFRQLNKEINKVKDEIMLGDAEKAIAAIAAFQNLKL